MYTSTSNLKPPHANPLSPFHTRHLRPNRRRRLKQQQKHAARAKPLVLCSASLLNPFQDFISRFPSPISLDLLAPALGLASGVSLYVSRLKKPGAPGDACEIGEWIFFTSPTPFNRFVLLRCPSVSFQGSEFLEDVNEKLVEEDRHFVRLHSGRIYSRGERGGDGLEDKLEYQRVCVNTKDGGVVSLDWPADLDLNEEHGLDTTLILVPGTAEGSMEENVRSFVVEALKRGFFPVVMNPRGCAGSPLTTARLFTAADSDDISTAIQFINKARPWTTLMGVGWGFGANMLTKYLGEVGDKTPLTAATCINNPFDLEEATRCSPYRNALDEKLTSGMIEILQSNKELFQGRTKRFDVETALSAKSVRDFEKAISMVSYGFGEIEDFYSKSSTTSVVGNVGIPVLFIQNDDGTAPLFSIPRSLIAENPFTSLLLCSCPPSSIIASERAAISWCQNLTVEWFTAVELGLLKGRHPLLNDVDVNINPIKGLSPVENRVSAKGARLNKLLDVTLTEATEPLGKTPEDANTVPTLHFNARGPSPGHLELEAGLQELLNGPLQPTNSIDAELIREQGYSSVDTVTSLAVPTAEVVMNMLDASMPDILSEEEKKKVLTAVSQGETLLRALETAVPLEVRGKITTAVSEIVQTQQSSLNFDRLLGISKIPSASTGVNTKSQEKAREVSGAQTLPKDQHSSEKMKRTDDLAGSSGNNQLGLETSGIGQEPELHPSEHIQKSSGLDQSQSVASQPGDTSASFRKPVIESVNNYANDEVNKEKTAPSSDNSEKRLETSTIANLNSQTEKVGGIEEAVVDDSKAAQGGGTHQLEMKKESNIQKTEEKPVGSSADHGKVELGSASEETLSPTGSSSDPQAMERENKNIQPAVDQSKPATPDSTPATFSVAQALDALTGMDDSTQVAVNSVFGVIENMISQLEEEKDDENKMEDTIEVKNEATGSASKKQHTTSDQEPKITENGNNNLHIQSDTFQESPMHKDIRNNVDSQAIASTGWLEEEPTKDSISFPGNNASDSPQDSDPNYEAKEEKDNDQILGSRSLADYSYGNKIDFPLYVTVNPYGDYIHKEYLRRYLLSKISNGKKLDLDTTTALFLDYFPEDGQWKLLEQTGDVDESTAGGVSTHDGMKENQADEYIEPSYVVLDTGRQHEHVAKYSTLDNFTDNVENDGDQLKLMQSVRTVILNALKVEVGRKLSTSDMKQIERNLAKDLEQVASAVSLAVVHDKDHTWCFRGKRCAIDHTTEKVGTAYAERIMRAVSSAVLGTTYLRRLMPIGVIIGSSLAALRKYFDVAPRHENGLASIDPTKTSGNINQDKVDTKNINTDPVMASYSDTSFNNKDDEEGEEAVSKNINNDGVMVGAVTAALGASALLVQQQVILSYVSSSFYEILSNIWR
ncbi:hypothetical protein Tsubulata_022318 [Turnera subulata]|uniref:DUF7750 domain-containing protein n=1 Tax=Turnera subulata TaxID=218843 RepID=A0A9Q0J9A9_9ROSI|nr:hypothetical protein Tsubulata_022318 [Turnera subulata]